MDEILKIEHKVISNAIGQAKFLAQQYYNKNGNSQRVVLDAKFVDGGIHVVYDEPEPEPKKAAPVFKPAPVVKEKKLTKGRDKKAETYLKKVKSQMVTPMGVVDLVGPDAVMQEPRPLTEAEKEEIKEAVGEDIAAKPKKPKKKKVAKDNDRKKP